MSGVTLHGRESERSQLTPFVLITVSNGGDVKRDLIIGCHNSSHCTGSITMVIATLCISYFEL